MSKFKKGDPWAAWCSNYGRSETCKLRKKIKEERALRLLKLQSKLSLLAFICLLAHFSHDMQSPLANSRRLTDSSWI